MNRILVLVFIMLLLCSACNRDSPSEGVNDSNKAFKSEVPSSMGGAQNCTKESLRLPTCWSVLEGAIFKSNPDLIHRENSELKIRLANGEFMDMKHPEGADIKLVRYFPDAQYGLLSIKTDKEISFDLVNLKTGIRINVGGDAILSPDKRRIAVFHKDLLGLVSKNVLAIYFVAPDGIIEEYRYEPDDWGVDSLGWADNKTIVTSITSIENSMENQSNQILRLTGDNNATPGRWGVELKDDLLRMTQSPQKTQTNQTSPEKTNDSVQALIAMIALYGGDEWDDSSLSEYFNGKTHGYIAPVFISRFTEDNMDKLAAVFHVTPEPSETYYCHACITLIGGAIFAKSKDTWVVESAAPIIGWGNGFGEEYRLAKIGPDKNGILIRISDAHQGYEVRIVRLITSINGVLSKVLDVGFGEAPGPGACLKKTTASQFLNIQFTVGNNPQYFDAITDTQFNEGTCKNFITIRRSERYIFAQGKYEVVATANK